MMKHVLIFGLLDLCSVNGSLADMTGKQPKELKTEMPLTIHMDNVIRERIANSLIVCSQSLGLEVADLTEKDRTTFKVKQGIKVTRIYELKGKRNTEIRVGFIIQCVNNISIDSKDQFWDIVSKEKESVLVLEGIYPDSPSIRYYAFEIE
jgi:hypothetical protein